VLKVGVVAVEQHVHADARPRQAHQEEELGEQDQLIVHVVAHVLRLALMKEMSILWICFGRNFWPDYFWPFFGRNFQPKF
jgi:hypothetical protein